MDDLISRDELLKLPKVTIRDHFGKIVQTCIDVEDIKQLPTAHPNTEKPKTEYERYLPCTCGCNRRSTWVSSTGFSKLVGLVCKRCGREVRGNSYKDAKRNWNKMIEDAKNMEVQL